MLVVSFESMCQPMHGKDRAQGKNSQCTTAHELLCSGGETPRKRRLEAGNMADDDDSLSAV